MINLDAEFRNQYRNITLMYSAGLNNQAVAAMKSKYDKSLALLPENYNKVIAF